MKLKIKIKRWLHSLHELVRCAVIEWAFKNSHGVTTLKDGTKVIRMSNEFYEWCYGRGYALWAGENRTEP